MLKCSVVICGVVLCIYSIVQGDTITLKSADKKTIDSRVLPNGSGDTVTLRMGSVDKDLELTVLGFTEEYVEARIEKKNIKSMKIQFVEGNQFPDIIFVNNIDTAVECKIKDVAEDAIRVLIPKSAISFLRVSAKQDSSKNKTDVAKSTAKLPDRAEEKKDTPQKKKQSYVARSSGDKSTESFVDDLRAFPGEKIKGEKNYRLRTIKIKNERLLDDDALVNAGIEANSTEILPHTDGIENVPELEKESIESNQNRVKDSMDAKGVTKPGEDPKGKSPVVQDLDLGWVEGKITGSGSPLPDCQVKLQILEKGSLLTKGYHPIEGAVAFETNTDTDGVYRVMNVPPGLYKLYWKPAGETSWVRRFKMEPDVIVEAGKATNPKTVETTKRTLN